MSRYGWAVAATAAFFLNVAFCFFCWVIAIWHPWGHANEWGTTGAAGLFPALILGFAAGFAWIGGDA